MVLTDSEQSLVDCVSTGTVLDLAPGTSDDAIDENAMLAWGPEHEIRAEVVRDLLRGRHLADGGADPRGLRLRGARIVGRIDLDHLTTSIVLTLSCCHLADGLSGEECRIPRLTLRQSILNASLEQSDTGALHLLGAHIGGRLNLRGARITNHAGPALNADGLRASGDAFLDEGFVAEGHGGLGTVRLYGAHLSGKLEMHNAVLHNDAGPALHAGVATFDRGVFLSGSFTATGHGSLGAVRLLGTHIGGQLNMRDATVANDAGPAVSADGVTVSGDAFFDASNDKNAFVASGNGDSGSVRLLGAHIGGQLSLRGAQLSNKVGPALIASNATVMEGTYLDKGFFATGQGALGVVRLAGTHIGGQLKVDSHSVDSAIGGTKWEVDGLSYDGQPSVGFEEWLRLLTDGTPAYRPQPYQQLATAARDAGHDGDARRARIAQRNDQIQRGGLSGTARAWARFTKLTLGYGYQPWRALLGVAGVLVIAVLCALFIPSAVLHTSTGKSCSVIESVQVAVDISVPLVSTSRDSPCRIASTDGGQLFAWVGLVLTFLGWALTALFAAGFTSAIRKP